MRWLLLLLAACAADEPDYAFDLPPGFVAPPVPAANPMSEAKVSLGRHLFFDVRLSVNARMSCATCHEPARAFADGKITPWGTLGTLLSRNAMGLANVGYLDDLTWMAAGLGTLEAQARVPLLADAPVELGFDESVAARLAGDERYAALFRAAYGDAAVDLERIVDALASFERTLISGDSAWDRGELSPAAIRGEAEFLAAGCDACHAPPLFTSGGRDENGVRVPSLRNLGLTGPYFHDGSAATLGEALERHAFVSADMEAFLLSLDDPGFAEDPRFSDPW